LRKISETGGFDVIWELDLFGKYRRLIEHGRPTPRRSATPANGWSYRRREWCAAYLDMRAQQNLLTVLGENIRPHAAALIWRRDASTAD